MTNQQGSLADHGIPHRSRAAKRASRSSVRLWPIWSFMLLSLVIMAALMWQLQQDNNDKFSRMQQLFNQQTALAERLDQLGLTEQSFASMQDLDELISQQGFFAQRLQALADQPTDSWQQPLAEMGRVQQEMAQQLLDLQQGLQQLGNLEPTFDDSQLQQRLAEQQQELTQANQQLQASLAEQSERLRQQILELTRAQQTASERQQALAERVNATAAGSGASDTDALRSSVASLESQLDDLAFNLELQRNELQQIRSAAGSDITLDEWVRAIDANRMEVTQRINSLMSR